MAKKGAVTVAGNSFVCQPGKIHGHAIIMSVGNKDPVSVNFDFFFSGKIGKEIIVSGYNGTGTFGKGFNIKFPSLYVAAVDQHVKGLLLHHCCFQMFIIPMSIADNKYFHRSWSLIARRALPLWLILFFSSIEISAEEHPYSGR